MLVILSGKSGSGKDALLHNFMEKHPGEALQLVSSTSRPMRDGEVNGREYFFTSKENFLQGIADNRFVEYRSYDTTVGGNPDTWYYGTQKFEKLGNDGLLIAIKDLEGAAVLKEYCQSIGEPCVDVLVTVDDRVREERAKKRGSFDQTEWNRRLKADSDDFSPEKIEKVCNFVLENTGSIDDLVTKFENVLETLDYEISYEYE